MIASNESEANEKLHDNMENGANITKPYFLFSFELSVDQSSLANIFCGRGLERAITGEGKTCGIGEIDFLKIILTNERFIWKNKLFCTVCCDRSG